MHGCGNDFILIDNRTLQLDPDKMGEWAKRLCQKGFGIHADGLVFLDTPPADSDLAFTWHFFNSDGSMGEMCGNASRCAALLAYKLGMAPAGHQFGTIAGSVRARVIKAGSHSGEVIVQLPTPSGLDLNREIDCKGQSLTVHHVVVGVPHAVVFVQDLSSVDVAKTGHFLRHHPNFSPRGVNVNFAHVLDRETIQIRTYERGVENETFACGTGAASTQFISSMLGYTHNRATVKTLKGFDLCIEMKDKEIYQQGPAVLTFKGEFYLTP